MRSNFFQYLVIFIIAIVLIIGAAFMIYNKESKNGEDMSEYTEKQSEYMKSMRLGIPLFDTVNPILSNNKTVQEISRIVYEPLLRITSDYRLENCLAAEFSKTSETTYIVRIKDNIIWHDDEKFTATDVQFTIDKLKNECADSVYAQNVSEIQLVEILDEYTVKITLNREIPHFEYNLVFPILANHQYINNDFRTSTINPAGTGMYKISEVNSDGIKLIENNKYWEEKEFEIEEINVKFYDSVGELYNAFKLGNVDFINTTITNVSDYIGTMGFNKKEYKGREYEFIAINTEEQALSYKEVRQAINYAIDKNNIVASVFGNNYYKADFPLDYNHWIYDEKKHVNVHDPNLAKQILTENGWEYKYSSWQKVVNYRTIRLDFDLVINSANATHLNIANLIKEQLGEIGIKITIRNVSEYQYRNYINNKNYDMIIVGINSAINIDLGTYFGEGNLSKFNNEEMNSIINDIKNIQEQSTLKEKYERIAQIYFDEVPYIGLYRNKNTVVYNPKLMGEITPNWYNLFYNINNWHREK